MAKTVPVEFYDIYDSADWNRIQNMIEYEHQWAITYVHRYQRGDGQWQAERWEVWVGGEYASLCDTFEEAQEAIRAAKKARGLD